MSAAKYANLPDIDTAPDVYETEDVFPTTHDNQDESSDEESGAAARGHGRGKPGAASRPEELDISNVDLDEASKKFRRAEQRQHRPKVQYVYPPSSSGDDPSEPSSPIHGELIKGMVDVKRNIEKMSKTRDGRSKLVSQVLGESGASTTTEVKAAEKQSTEATAKADAGLTVSQSRKPETRDIVDMDRRVAELEKLVGSSSTALDELSPLPPPLLPLLVRLNSQLALLTQPRHIDSITRRIKLLNAEFERTSNAGSSQAHSTQRRGHTSASGASSSVNPAGTGGATASGASSTALQEQLAPVLTKLALLMPHVPHVLTRLRTLATLHTSASNFEKALGALEEDQSKTRAALEDLARAVEGIEKSLGENEQLVRSNVKELEERIVDLGRRVERLEAGS